MAVVPVADRTSLLLVPRISSPVHPMGRRVVALRVFTRNRWAVAVALARALELLLQTLERAVVLVQEPMSL